MTSKATMQTGAGGAIVPTSNIALVHSVMTTLTTRTPGLPGIGALYGESGLGKSSAAAYASHREGFNGLYVTCRSVDTKKSFTERLCVALGVKARGNIPDLIDAFTEALALANRPLIIDEVDHIAGTRTLELIRDIHDISGATVLLIGEEALPAKLKGHERFDNRILVWQPAAKCSETDFDRLAKQYASGIEIAPELRARILAASGGITRRVVVNLANVQRWCGTQGTKRAGADAAVELYTGMAPGRRAAHGA